MITADRDVSLPGCFLIIAQRDIHDVWHVGNKFAFCGKDAKYIATAWDLGDQTNTCICVALAQEGLL